MQSRDAENCMFTSNENKMHNLLSYTRRGIKKLWDMKTTEIIINDNRCDWRLRDDDREEAEDLEGVKGSMFGRL